MRIFGIGTVVVDHVVRIPSIPEVDTKQTIQHHWKQVGGPVPVALSTAAFYGTKSNFLGRWGDDEAGRYIAQTLSQREIDISMVDARTEWSTGFSHVWIESKDGTRTISCFRGDFPVPNENTISQSQISKKIAQCGILHVDGWAPQAAVAAAKQVKSQGGIVVLDAGSIKPGMENLFPYVDYLIASALFRKSCFGDSNASISKLRELGCKKVVSTDGANDLQFWDGNELQKVSVPEVSVVDSNGAGDIFSGALLHAIGNNWEMDRAITFAVSVASWSCGREGNSEYPSTTEVGQCLSS